MEGEKEEPKKKKGERERNRERKAENLSEIYCTDKNH